MMRISDVHLDALGEIFNIGVGRAAASLSQIVKDDIDMSAPKVFFINLSEIKNIFSDHEFDRLSVITQMFKGPFDVQTILVFPEKNALSIVAQMLGNSVPPEQLGEFEQEALSEVGNIILNACISAFADLFKVEFTGSLPNYEQTSREYFDLLSLPGHEKPVLLIVQINLSIHQKHIKGNLVFLMSVSSMSGLLKSINTYLASMGLPQG